MQKLIVSSFVVALLAGTTVVNAQDMMRKVDPQEMMKKMMEQMPKPGKEHKWLNHCVGEWELEGEHFMAPGEPGQKMKGFEKVEMLGGFWLVYKIKIFDKNAPMNGILTLGYDLQKEKYVGTWVDSMTDYLWTYEGTMNKEGTKLTLYSEGPAPGTPHKMIKFKEIIEIKNKDLRTFTSLYQAEDGTWNKMMTMTARRKK